MLTVYTQVDTVSSATTMMFASEEKNQDLAKTLAAPKDLASKMELQLARQMQKKHKIQGTLKPEKT